MKSFTNLKKTVRIIGMLPIILLAIGMMAQPAIIFYNYMNDNEAKDVSSKNHSNITEKNGKNDKALNLNKSVAEDSDSLEDIDVETNDYDEMAFRSSREQRGFHSDASKQGYQAGLEAGTNDGMYGNPRYQQYDDSNSYDESESLGYRTAYEKGYNVGYNSNYKD